MNINYRDAGVDIDKAERLVNKLKIKVEKTYKDRVLQGIGGFASLYKIDDKKLLAAGTDGVGTKLQIAKILNVHSSIGIDLVAMCINDVICTGAKPLFFMDYIACGKLNENIVEDILEGILEGCQQSDMPLIGGETAEMPGMYNDDEYDLAGFAIGEIYKKDLWDGKNIKSGDSIIALPSSGFHSNGFSLIRKLVNKDERDLLFKLLTPTRIYHRILDAVDKSLIKGCAHITGGGFLNIARINKNFDYKIENLIPMLDFMDEVINRSKLSMQQQAKTFNMGVGLALITENSDKLLLQLKEGFLMGKVIDGNGRVILPNGDIL